jgi:hypothetical protein
MVQVDPIQSYLNLKIGPTSVLKAGSSGNIKNFLLNLFEWNLIPLLLANMLDLALLSLLLIQIFLVFDVTFEK